MLYTTRIHNDINNNAITNTYEKTQANTNTGDSVVSDTKGLLTPDFGSTRRERQNSYYADHTIWPPQTRSASCDV